MKNIGQLIVDQRQRLNISQSELADKLGVTKSFMSKMGNGKKPISLKRLAQIGEVLEIEFLDCVVDDNLLMKWKPVIDMFEKNNISPDNVLLLNDFFIKIKN